MSLSRMRHFLWILLGLAAVGMAALLWQQSAQKQALSETSLGTIGGPFTLVGTDGKTFASARLNGKPAAIFFGFTHCPDVCPTTLARLTKLRHQLGKGDDGFSIVFVSV